MGKQHINLIETGDQRIFSPHDGLPTESGSAQFTDYSHSAFPLAHSTLGNTDLFVALTCIRFHLKVCHFCSLHGLSFLETFKGLVSLILF